MDQPQSIQQPGVAPTSPEPQKRKPRRGCGAVVLLIALATVAFWFFAKPGVFTVQPIGAIPEGITFEYHPRNPEMSLFSSPDGLCLEMQGSVSLLCRVIALGAVGELSDRIMILLPYSHWDYLQSTVGLQVGQ